MINVDQNTFLDINLSSISKNYNIIKKKVRTNCHVAATVKADAYGLGVSEVVKALVRSNCNYFFVATTNEAIELRKINKKIKIFILNGLITNDLGIVKKYNLIPVINSLKQLKKIEEYQLLKNIILDVALHFDTGMCRLGLDKNETEKLIQHKSNLIKKSNVLVVMSHLACADDKKSKKNLEQLNNFIQIIKYFPNAMKSLANSAGILLGKKYHFDLVRPGISLYGGDCQINEKNKYNNVVSLKAKLIQIRQIKKNDTVGYGATYVAKKNMIIGTLGFGYADGFNRSFSNNYYVTLRNKKLYLLGRVSMDLITIDLESVKSYKKLEDETFEIIGNNNSINKISKLIGTIPYEILTNLGKRYQRRYIS